MGPLGQALSWLFTSSHWLGTGGILQRLSEHIQMFAVAMVIACVIALPAGMLIGHTRRGAFLAINAAATGRALPSIAVLAVAYAFTLRWPGPFGYWATLITLVLLAVPPLLTNTYVAVSTVDPDTLEAARGMGMGERQVLLGVEVPLAAPLILDTLRTVAVQVVATAAIGAVIGWGGLGRFIVDGIPAPGAAHAQLLGGAILVAVLSVLVDAAFGALGRFPAVKRVRA